MNFLRDPAWQGIDALLAVIALVATFAFAYYAQRRKRLAYRYTVSPVVSVESQFRERVRVTLDGEEVQGIHVQEFTVVNVGGEPITPADFETPLAIKHAAGVRVLTAEIVTRHPSDLRVELALGNAALSIPPLLLNPADGFTIRLLLSGDGGRASIKGRIAGVREFDWLDRDTQPQYIRVTRALIATVPFFVAFQFASVGRVASIAGGILVAVLAFGMFFLLGDYLLRRWDPYRKFLD